MNDENLFTRSADAAGRINLGKEYQNQSVYVKTLSRPESDLPVYFIRHGRVDGTGFAASEEGLKSMFEDHVIALDWNTGGRVAKDLFRKAGGEKAVTDIETIQKLARDGGRVFAVYPSLWTGETEYALIGDALPSTPLETKKYEAGGRQKSFNTLQLTNVIEISENEESLLFDSQDEQPARGTIRRWRKHPDTVNEVYEEYW